MQTITVSNSLIHHVHRVVKESCDLMQIEKPKGILTFESDFKVITDNKLSYDDYIRLAYKNKNYLLRGCYDKKTHYVFINIKKHITINEIDETIVHELIHKKYPAMKHGIKFNSLVELYLLKLTKCDHIFNKGYTLNFKSHSSTHIYLCHKCNLELKDNVEIINRLVEIKDKEFRWHSTYKLNAS